MSRELWHQRSNTGTFWTTERTSSRHWLWFWLLQLHLIGLSLKASVMIDTELTFFSCSCNSLVRYRVSFWFLFYVFENNTNNLQVLDLLPFIVHTISRSKIIEWIVRCIFINAALWDGSLSFLPARRARIPVVPLLNRRVEKPKKPRPLEVKTVITRTAACVKHVQSRLQWQLTLNPPLLKKVWIRDLTVRT